MYSAEHSVYLSALKKRKIFVLATQLFILMSFFVLWEVAAANRWIEPFIFSQPTRMYAALVFLLQNNMLWEHVLTTLWVTVVGFTLGTLLGVIFATALWWSGFASRVMAPYLVVLNALPKTALAPILIVWFGNNVRSVIITALLISVIVSILTILHGFNNVDGEKLKLIKTFGGNKSQALFKLIIPANVPTIISATKINVGLSMVGVIVGEFLVARAGLGYLIIYGSQIFSYIYKQILFSYTFTFNYICYLIKKVIKEIQVYL